MGNLEIALWEYIRIYIQTYTYIDRSTVYLRESFKFVEFSLGVKFSLQLSDNEAILEPSKNEFLEEGFRWRFQGVFMHFCCCWIATLSRKPKVCT